MSDYQAIYDAVRSRISNGNIGEVARDVMWQMFDISHQKAILQETISIVSNEMTRPSVVFRPILSTEGDMWCALLGENLQTGVAGFGETPCKAMEAFDAAFYKERTPAAIRSLKKENPDAA